MRDDGRGGGCLEISRSSCTRRRHRRVQRNTAAPGATCDVVNDNCAGDTVCVPSTSTCQPAFPRTYQLSGLSLSVPTTMPDGSSWDAGGGAPDLFVVVKVDGATIGTTSVVQDSFTASWNETYTFTLSASSVLEVDSNDEDIAANDPVLNCTAAPVTVDQVRDRLNGCQSTGYDFTFTLLAQ
jgi:hypothetical protein